MLFQLYFIVSLSVVAFAITLDDCPPGLERDSHLSVFGNKCYRFEYFMQKKYHDAETHCQIDGGNLAIVKTDDVNEFIRKSLSLIVGYNMNPFWIGLHYDTSNKGFKWVDGSIAAYNHFQETVSKNIKVKECIAVVGETGYWNSYTCHSNDVSQEAENRFICEYTISPSTTPSTTTPSTTTTFTTTITTTTRTSMLTHASENVSSCPSSITDASNHFRKSGNICYYYNTDLKQSYWDSERYCQKHGGILAIANSAITNKFIQSLLMDNTPNVNYYSEPAWIGLRFVASKNGYFWSDGTPQVYTNYEESGSIRECVAMFPWDGLWKEKMCQWNVGNTSEKHHFVCQFEAPNPSTTKPITKTTTSLASSTSTTRRPRI